VKKKANVPMRSPPDRPREPSVAPDPLRNENVETLASLRARAALGVSRHQRRIERITSRIGRPRSFYLAMALVATWIAYNGLGSRLGVRPFDPPPFSLLQALVGVGALLMTTMIVITQNRQTAHAEQRAELELQVNLLAEQKVAKLIALVEELRRDIPSVRDRVDQAAEIMKEPVDPHAVLSALEQTLDAPSSDEVADEAPRTESPRTPRG
jgi:uncharacterized membrane protein